MQKPFGQLLRILFDYQELGGAGAPERDDGRSGGELRIPDSGQLPGLDLHVSEQQHRGGVVLAAR